MAKGKVTCAFLLVLILSHGILSSEGRELKAGKNRERNKCAFTDEENGEKMDLSSDHYGTLPCNVRELKAENQHAGAAPGHGHGGDVLVREAGEDYRNTTPGHSPGAGHGYVPGSSDP
ncbi:unnamed protein product [Ilex paraguariensis]|uniref:Uncharacterized protein n=1 Tax=Ilex paraguariensis TaxID=185542 RepID=A0ABC8UE36_9AQUA